MATKIFEKVFASYDSKNQSTLKRVMGVIEGVEYVPAPMPVAAKADEHILMTPEKAAQFLGFDTFDDQRGARYRRLHELCLKAIDGRFRKSEVAFAYFQGEKYLVNGKHTCLSCVMTNTPLNVSVSHYKCRTMEELATLWQQFDTGGTRSPGDMSSGTCRQMGEGWEKSQVTTISKGLAIHVHGITKQYDLQREERINLVTQHAEVAKTVRSIVYNNKGKKWKHLAKGPIVAVIIASLETDSELAKEFWLQVGDGVNLRSGEPAYKLREYLLSATSSHTRSSKSKELATEEDMITKSRKQWEACLKTERFGKMSTATLTNPKRRAMLV